MSKNVSYIYIGVSGLFCQCGNIELITDENPSYKRFTSWWDTSGAHGMSKVSCLKCNSETHTPEVRPQPSDLPERLQAAFPGADVEQLLAMAATGQ